MKEFKEWLPLIVVTIFLSVCLVFWFLGNPVPFVLGFSLMVMLAGIGLESGREKDEEL